MCATQPDATCRGRAQLPPLLPCALTERSTGREVFRARRVRAVWLCVRIRVWQVFECIHKQPYVRFLRYSDWDAEVGARRSQVSGEQPIVMHVHMYGQQP